MTRYVNRDVWDGKKALVDSRLGARTVGTVAMIAPGWRVWSKPGEVCNPDGEPVGGIVLEIVDSRRTNPEDPIVRTFHTIDPKDLSHQHLTEAQVDPEGLQLPDAGEAHKTISRLAKELEINPRARRSLLDNEPRRLETVRVMFLLAVGCRNRLVA